VPATTDGKPPTSHEITNSGWSVKLAGQSQGRPSANVYGGSRLLLAEVNAFS
jgi:hypothetical protein